MSEQNKKYEGSLLEYQKKNKAKIEDFISEYLDGDMKKLALDFVAHMRENKMTLRWAGFTNAWKAVCKGRCICYINLSWGDVKWLVTPYLENINDYEGSIISESLQDFVLDNVIYCCHADKYERPEGSPPVKHFGLNYPCNLWNCAPGADIIVCGKEIKNKCRNGNRRFYWFKNPGAEEIEAVKKLLDFEKKARTKNTGKI